MRIETPPHKKKKKKKKKKKNETHHHRYDMAAALHSQEHETFTMSPISSKFVESKISNKTTAEK